MTPSPSLPAKHVRDPKGSDVGREVRGGNPGTGVARRLVRKLVERTIESPKRHDQGASFNTLAQLDQNDPAPTDAFGRSPAEVENNLRKRARAKYMTLPLATALADLGSELEQSYRNTIYCAGCNRQEGDAMHTRYCGNRWCLVCNRIRIARAIATYKPIVEEWAAPYMVTLTVRNCAADELPGVLDEMMAAFTSAKRSITRTHGLDFLGLRKLECTHNSRRKDYHPHFHVVVDGEQQATLLREKWLRAFGDRADGRGQDVRPCDREKGLTELFKYFTKLTTKRADGKTRGYIPVEALDVIFRAMKGRRVWQPFGFRISDYQDEQIEGDELVVDGSPAFKRLGEQVMWLWEQDLGDWIDHRTGETLSGYTPSEQIRQFVPVRADEIEPQERPPP